jgi:hypothetical protein
MDMNEFGVVYTRPATGDVRFSAPMLMAVLGKSAARGTGAKLQELGATLVGQARVNNALSGWTQKDIVYSVPCAEWEEFSARCLACTDWASLVEAAPKLTMEQRMRRVEALLRIGQ